MRTTSRLKITLKGNNLKNEDNLKIKDDLWKIKTTLKRKTNSKMIILYYSIPGPVQKYCSHQFCTVFYGVAWTKSFLLCDGSNLYRIEGSAWCIHSHDSSVLFCEYLPLSATHNNTKVALHISHIFGREYFSQFFKQTIVT